MAAYKVFTESLSKVLWLDNSFFDFDLNKHELVSQESGFNYYSIHDMIFDVDQMGRIFWAEGIPPEVPTGKRFANIFTTYEFNENTKEGWKSILFQISCTKSILMSELLRRIRDISGLDIPVPELEFKNCINDDTPFYYSSYKNVSNIFSFEHENKILFQIISSNSKYYLEIIKWE